MKATINSDNKTVICLLIIGILLTILIPLLLPVLPLDYLKDFGTIGSAFGGIAGPIAQIIGFILLYLALRERVNANLIVQKQAEAKNAKEMQQRNVKHLHELYTLLENNINNFSYERKVENSKNVLELYGRRAIRCFIDDIEDMNIDLHNDEQLLHQDGVREILSILKIAEHIFENINHADIEESDKAFYLNIMKHELTFSIFPYSDLDESANLKLALCETCNEFHGNYPPLIFKKLQNLKKHFVQG
ncbi:hypothetical protein [Sphingobacterium mizutaii]|uniref:hypothetical protein n=1 Tax=Sphingobacterium mizutaii TaxID=1010 RepID=UPI001624B4B0|nr:hypothetical protein [Sphingobacterium mizutaii]